MKYKIYWQIATLFLAMQLIAALAQCVSYGMQYFYHDFISDGIAWIYVSGWFTYMLLLAGIVGFAAYNGFLRKNNSLRLLMRIETL